MRDYNRLPEIRMDSYTVPCYGIGTYGRSLKEIGDLLDHYPYQRVMIDTASRYENESDVGRAICCSGIRRDDIVLIGKISRSQQLRGDIDRVVEESLEALRCGYFDIYLIHSPRGCNYVQTWEKLLTLKSRGVLKHVGVSGFDPDQIIDLYEYSGVYPEVNQIVPFSMTCKERESLIDFCSAKGISVQAAQPFGGPGNSLNDLQRREILLGWYERNIVSICGTRSVSHMLENLNTYM